MIQLTHLYHKIIEDMAPINVAVDMTCGHGYDTLFLAQISKKVYGFDIQKSAITETEYRLKAYNHIHLIKDDHQYVDKYVKEAIDVAIFNLGYMPGGDFSIKTQTSSTLNALKNLLPLMNQNGLIVLELYPHNPDEVSSIIHFAQSINKKNDVIKLDLINKENPPSLLIIKINETPILTTK